MNRAEKFWNRIARKYSRRPVADEESYQKKLAVTREYLQPDWQVLEFGCGTGSTALAHAPYVKHIRATDLSSEMIAIAREKAAAAGIANVTFEQASIEELDVADGSLDAVLGLSILHLLEDMDAAIAKVYRMLRPGGIFVTSTPCLIDMMPLFRLILPVGRFLGFFPLVKVFSLQQLQDSFRTAGFDIDYEWQPGKNKAVFIVVRKS